MKIPLKSLELRPKGHVVGCGVQGSKCLALDLSQGKGGKWTINWSLTGDLGDGCQEIRHLLVQEAVEIGRAHV